MTVMIFYSLISLFLTISNFGDEGDWPDWRGVNRDGTWHEKGVIKSFDSEFITPKWSVPVSTGYSGPTVSDQRVYVTDRTTKPARERVHCYNANTGELIWSFNYDCDYYGVGYPAGPRASVVIDEDRAYSLGTMGHLFCFDKATGKVLWKKDLNIEYEIRMPIWGIAAAPLIYGKSVILNIGGSNNACVVALDKLTGMELWRNLEDDASYVAPILIKQAAKDVLVVWSGQNVVGMNPENGTVYWIEEFEQKKMVINIATPVVENNYLFVSSFYDGSMLLKLDEEKLEVKMVWRRQGKSERNTDALHCIMSTPVILGDYIYGVDSYGELRCLDLHTGDRIWEDLTAVKKARWANIYFVQNGDIMYMFNEQGELLTANLSAEGFHEISRAKLIEPTHEQLNRSGEGVTWAHPAFAYKHVFVRSDKELICADLSER
jgi:outer membrane protein assembly factor BamB